MHFSSSKIFLFLVFSSFHFNSPSFSASFLPANTVNLFGDASFRNNSISLTQQHNCTSSPPTSPLSPPSPPSPAAAAASSKSLSGIGRAFSAYPVRFLDPSTDSVASFSCSFSFTIFPTPSCPFGDGLAFLITSNAGSLSLSDGFMGLPELGPNSNDSFVAVEFDTSLDPSLEDVNDNHIGVDVNKMRSLVSVDVLARGIDLKSGRGISAWIEYSDSIKMIKVWVSYSQVRPSNPVLAAQIDLSKQFKEFMHVGFSASNGLGSAVHSVVQWRFKTNWIHSTTMPMETVNEDDCMICFPNDTFDHNQKSKRLPGIKAGLIGGSAAFGVFVFAALLVICVFLIRRRRRRKRSGNEGNEGQICRFQGNRVPQRLSLAQIKSATEGFNENRVIGEGGSAVVYEGSIPSRGAVAVKRFVQGKRFGPSHVPFNTEFASMVGCLRHKNLIQLQGWCCERNELVLVYEYMPNGSLDKILHKRTNFTKFLTWERRLNIVLGVCSALIYLHEECQSQIIHRDVKTCNIMLDIEFNAKLGDFGLAEVYDSSRTRDATVPAGTMGYLAPEYAFSGIPTVKTDVYSFGVVVLEVASGRRPVDEDGTLITDWVWDLWEKRKITEAADPRLMGRFNPEEMERMLMTGLLCVHPNHMKRPIMREAARLIRGESPLPVLPARKPVIRMRCALPEGCDEILSLGDEVDDTPWSTPRTHFSRN